MTKYFIIIGALLFGLIGCSDTRRQALTNAETKTCAWLIEDVCHGLTRSPGELVRERSSISQLNIAAWLAKGDISTKHDSFPMHVQKRRDQWLLIRQGLVSKAISSQDNGLLALAEDIDDVQRQIFAKSVENENQLRLTVDQLTLQHAGLQARSERGRTLLRALQQARIELDRSMGK